MEQPTQAPTAEPSDFDRRKAAILKDIGDRARAKEARALWELAEAGNFAEVKRLLDAGVNVNGNSDGGVSALIIASSRGHSNVVRLLLERGAAVNARTDNGTALHSAVTFGHAEVVEILLASGIDVNAHNQAGATALSLAILHMNTKIIDLLKKAGARE